MNEVTPERVPGYGATVNTSAQCGISLTGLSATDPGSQSGVTMNNSEGWIKLHRKITDSRCWTYSLAMRSVWLTILLRANHKRGYWSGAELVPGQFVTSYSHLAEEAMVSISQVRTCLKWLLDWTQIKCENIAQRMTRITICNWQTYQEASHAESHTVDMLLARRSHAVDNKQECKNGRTKEAKKETDSSDAASTSPSKLVVFQDSRISGVTPEITSAWKKAYPAVDITGETLRAEQWLVANPAKRKKNLYRFLCNWFSRQQEKGGSAIVASGRERLHSFFDTK